jgi:hypothetical protein
MSAETCEENGVHAKDISRKRLPKQATAGFTAYSRRIARRPPIKRPMPSRAVSDCSGP